MIAGSVQLRQYRELRGSGCPREAAAAQAGISIYEAVLTDKDDARDAPTREVSIDPPGPRKTLSLFKDTVSDGVPDVPQSIKTRKENDMAKDEPKVTNLTSTKKVLAEAAKSFREIDKTRSELNDWAGEVRERCREMGIDPKWLLTAIRVSDMEPEAREKADESYAIARDAIGLSFRQSLFDDLDEREQSEVVASKVKARNKLKEVPQEPYEGDNEDLAG